MSGASTVARGAVSRYDSWIGPLAAVSTAVLYGTSWVAAGIALKGFTPFTAALWRSVVTVVVLAPVLVWLLLNARSRAPARGTATPVTSATSATPRPISGRLVRLAVLGLLGGAGFGIGMNVSIQLTGAAITAFIAGAYPVVAAAAAPLVLKERTRPIALVGLVLAFLGTLLIAGFDVRGIRVDGTLIGVATAVGTGIFLLLTRRWSAAWSLSPASIAMSMFLMLGIAGGAIAIALGQPLFPANVPSDALLATLWLGIVAGGVASVFLGVSLRRLPASESSAYLMLNPLTGAVLAVPMLGDVLSAIQIVGAGLVLGGIGLATGTFAMLNRRLRGGPARVSGTEPRPQADGSTEPS